MIINMQTNCSNDCAYYRTASGILSSDDQNKVAMESEINFKLNYPKQSESLDTKSRDDGIVAFCVKQQTYQSEKAELALSNPIRSAAKVHSTRNYRTTLQQNYHSDLRLNSIPFTLQPASDSSKRQLDSTTFDNNCKNRIRKDLARASVTDSVPVELKRQNKSVKGTEAKVNYNPKLKVFKPGSVKEEKDNLIHIQAKESRDLRSEKKEQVSRLRNLNSNNQNNSKTKVKASLQITDLKLQSSKNVDVADSVPSHISEENCGNSSCHSSQQLHQPAQENTGSNKPLYIQNKVPLSAKYRFSNLKLKSAASLSKNFHHYQSAIDLSHREFSKKEVLLEEHQTLNLGAGKYAKLVTQRRKNQEERETFNCESKVINNKVTPDKKRLCKSLSNLTAEDVLSVPCSSIFDRRRIPIHNRKTPTQNGLNSEPKQAAKTDTTAKSQTTQVRPDNAMSKHIKATRTRQYKSNGKTSTVDEREGSRSDGTRALPIEEKRSEKLTGRKLPSSEAQGRSDDSKPAKKTPKLAKSLFPFMWKNRKRQSPPQTTEQVKPMKAKESRSSPPTTDTTTRKTEATATQSLAMNKTVADNLDENDTRAYEDAATGFKKLKVPSKKAQLNIHSAYATRAARVRSDGTKSPLSASTETSPKSDTSHDQSRDHGGIRNLLGKDFRVILRNKRNSKHISSRFSADLSSSTDSLPTRPLRKRPSSLAVPTKDSTSRYSQYSKSSFNLACFTGSSNTPDDSEITNKHSHMSVDEKNPVNPPNKVVVSITQENQPVNHLSSHNALYKAESPSPERGSFDINGLPMESSHSASLSSTIINENSASNLSALSTPSSSVLTTSYLSVTRMSLASSLGSVFEDDPLEKLESAGLEGQEEDFDMFSLKPSTTIHRNIDLVQRSKSLCRQRTAPGSLHVEQNDNRRSISPSFMNNRFKPTSSQPNIVVGKPPSLPSSRHPSVKDLSPHKRPSKPTTPKPRKIGSFSSLNKLNFFPIHDEQTEAQNVATGADHEVTLRNVDVRGRASAKNAQIRRRMSLQLFKSRNVEGSEEVRQIKEFEDFTKRHSMGGLDFEKVKSTMAKWSILPSSGSGSIGRRTRGRARPLSDVQNLRWEVQAIPEHKEIVNIEPIQKPSSLPRSSVLSGMPVQKDSFPHSGAVPKNAHVRAVVRKLDQTAILGTSFSEEDIPSLRNEEFSYVFHLPRSLSVTAGINMLQEAIYRDQFCWENRRLPFSPNRVSVISHFIHNHQERTRGQGSTVSGISNESGYGSMSRSGNRLRPDMDDEDVFTRVNSSRLSNDDFPSADGLYVEALWDHVTMDDDELAFKVGDVIRVIDMTNADWWWGELESIEGWFPATFVRILVNQHRGGSDNDDEDCSHVEEEDSCECSRVTTFDDDEDTCTCGKRKSTSSIHCSNCGRPVKGIAIPPAPRESKNPLKHPEIIISAPTNTTRKTSLNREQIRKNVINEIVNSEKSFVGHLKDVVQGYLTRCRNRRDMFSDEQVSLVFGNIEEIYEFQRKFAVELDAAVNRSSISSTELGKIFLKYKSGFKIYSEYCNNHTQALALLSQFFTVKKYMQFFETCRLRQRMIDISLDGFLLTPVQKICKYPLQLAELLKYTSPDHPDYEPVQSALVAMKDVARMINERKRMMENIRKISMWQSSVMTWQGEDILVRSNELVHSGEVFSMKQSKSKPKPRMVFLFDHQLIICKKDLLRKDLLYYKTRVDLDRYVMTPMEGYSPRSSAHLSGDWSSTGSGSMQFGWKLTDRKSGDSMIMLCKNEEDYEKWMRVFPREREIALSHREYDFNFRDELAKDLLKATLVQPRKPKDSSSARAPTYRYRARMAQEANLASKQKLAHSAIEKGSTGFFSSVAGKFTRRATVRETNVVY